MTQGFQPGQPVTQAVSQAGYPQQAGYMWPNNAPSSGGRGWAIALGLVGLLPLIFFAVNRLVHMLFDFDQLFTEFVFITFWSGSRIQTFLGWVFHVLTPNLAVVSAVMSMFRSAAGRILLVISMAFTLVSGTLTLIVEGAVPLPWFYPAIPILILAFLPPVNGAFRKTSARTGTPQMGSGNAAMAQQYGAYPQSQPQPAQQAGYPQQQAMQYPQQMPPQQQWQQPPQR